MRARLAAALLAASTVLVPNSVSDEHQIDSTPEFSDEDAIAQLFTDHIEYNRMLMRLRAKAKADPRFWYQCQDFIDNFRASIADQLDEMEPAALFAKMLIGAMLFCGEEFESEQTEMEKALYDGVGFEVDSFNEGCPDPVEVFVTPAGAEDFECRVRVTFMQPAKFDVDMSVWVTNTRHPNPCVAVYHGSTVAKDLGFPVQVDSIDGSELVAATYRHYVDPESFCYDMSTWYQMMDGDGYVVECDDGSGDGYSDASLSCYFQTDEELSDCADEEDCLEQCERGDDDDECQDYSDSEEEETLQDDNESSEVIEVSGEEDEWFK